MKQWCNSCEQFKEDDEFYTCDPRCKECNRARARMDHAANRQVRNATTNRWGKLNRDKHREYERNYYHRSKEKDNGRWVAKVRKRQMAKKNRTPPWVDHKEIVDFYRNCPPGMEVDHIVPIQGQNVSGLHVLWNLQYLTPAENRRKHNK